MGQAKRDAASTADDGPSRPMYVEVAEQLLAEIEDGEYEVGAKLPTEAVLRDRFGVSRSTIRQALGELESAGLVERLQGSGTTLVQRQRLLRYVLSTGSENDLLRYAAETTLRLNSPSVAPSLADCRRLRLGSPSNWRRWEGVRSESPDGLPIGLTAVYLPVAYAEVIKGTGGTRQGAIFELVLRRFGMVLTQIDQVISAAILDDDEAQRLDAEPGTPALVITRRYSTASGLIEVAENLHPADRFSYELQLERDPTTDRTVWP